MAKIAPSTTCGSSASGKTICGLFPPSSRETGTIRSPAASMIVLPTSREPVKESFLTRGCLAKGTPHSGPVPVTTLSTPRGKNSEQMRAIIKTARGASEETFRTRVLPAVMAMAILRAPRATGEFQGIIPATTPIGSRRE